MPRGPNRIVGNSIGGHFGYAVALHLQAAGREIAGFCAIDSFMITSSEPSAGRQRRALVNAVDLDAKPGLWNSSSSRDPNFGAPA